MVLKHVFEMQQRSLTAGEMRIADSVEGETNIELQISFLAQALKNCISDFGRWIVILLSCHNFSSGKIEIDNIRDTIQWNEAFSAPHRTQFVSVRDLARLARICNLLPIF